MREIIELLQMKEWDSNNEYINIAKGKYELPSTFKGWRNMIKRNLNKK